MEKLHTFYYFLDLAGTFAFAISGATAAKQRGLDLFGICVVAFTVACGGGIIRDVCIGAIPPAGLTTWYYLAAAILAAAMTIGLYPVVQRLNRPVILFDALGLSFHAQFGSRSYETQPASASEDFSIFGRNWKVPYVFWFVGGTDPKIFLEAKKNNQLNSIPSNHSPKFAPVIHPTLKTGLQAIMTAAAVWFN